MIKHISTRLILFIWTTICLASGGGRHWQVVANGQHDFQFEAEDDLQVVFAEPIDSRAASKTTQKLQGYAQEIAECPLSDDKIVLSLVLRALNWDNIVERKQERAIHKLSSFFAIPKKFISRANIDNDDVKEMQRHSLRHSSNHLVLRDGKTLGKIEFIIGCDDELFKSGSLIANQIKLQMADGSIDDIAGIEFGYWSVWVRPARNNGVPRSKRQTDGSGAFGEDEYEEYEDDDFENDEITEPPHTHRHRHGSDKSETDDTPAIITTTIPSQPSTTLSSDEDIVNSVTDINTSTLQPQTTSSSSSSFSTTTTESSTIVVVEPKETATERTSVTTGKPIASATQTPAVEDDFDGDYDDLAYDDDDEEETTQQTVEVSSQRSAIDMVPNIPIIAETTSTTTAPTTTTTVPTTTERLTTTEFIEPEPVNTPPYIKSRMQKQPVMAGKPFSLIVPEETFYDNEDGSNLRLAMYEKNDTPLKSNSWIQFNPETREIYGLPLDVVVSRYQYKLKATDSSNATVTETLDITVQQHKAHRTINHEISIGLKLQKKFNSNVDWQIRLIRGIVETLGDDTMSNVFVREIRTSVQDPTAATFVYSNETFPKDECPEEKLDQLIAQMDIKKLKESMYPEISIASVSGQPIANCQKVAVDKPKPPATTKNFSPVPRNQIDKISAVIGQLLIFKVPQDTFYDPEDNTDLKLSLQSLEGPPLDPKHWLQFDSKNNEFYGIPKYGDSGERNYVLVAEDSGGQTASDALVVSVSHAQHRDYNAQFEMTLGIQPENFNNSATQRRFAERLAAVFGDQTTSSIQIRAIRRIHNTGHTLVSFYNTTLHRSHHRCPHDEIDQLREVLVHKDGSIRHNVRSSLGEEFDLLRFNLVPMGVCVAGDTVHGSLYPVKTDEPATGMKDDYLLTFVLPAVIILAMLLVALVVACVLHRRRLTGKMELGDEEERRSFRSKGIPVIFQDELDEKPEIGNKSPIILKDEKPPLLPPSYTSTNPDDVDEYVPPPAVVMGGRESRGKSPVTPSYRKPPPYVSP